MAGALAFMPAAAHLKERAGSIGVERMAVVRVVMVLVHGKLVVGEEAMQEEVEPAVTVAHAVATPASKSASTPSRSQQMCHPSEETSGGGLAAEAAALEVSVAAGALALAAVIVGAGAVMAAAGCGRCIRTKRRSSKESAKASPT